MGKNKKEMSKLTELVLSGIISIIVAFVVSKWTVEHKLNERDREKLNTNFSSLEKNIAKIRDHHFFSVLLLSKLLHTRKDLTAEQLRDARELLEYLKKIEPEDFDAITMKVDSSSCESFREFYKKNKKMIHENHMGHLKSKIEACIPDEERFTHQ